MADYITCPYVSVFSGAGSLALRFRWIPLQYAHLENSYC